MQTTVEGLRRIKAFAREAGVTIRRCICTIASSCSSRPQ